MNALENIHGHTKTLKMISIGSTDSSTGIRDIETETVTVQ